MKLFAARTQFGKGLKIEMEDSVYDDLVAQGISPLESMKEAIAKQERLPAVYIKIKEVPLEEPAPLPPVPDA